MTLSGTGFEDIYPSPDFLTHQHADEYDLSVSEYVKDLIEQGRGYDELADRLESYTRTSEFLSPFHWLECVL